MPSSSAIAENLEAVRRRMHAAAARARRDPDSIQLVAVSKTFPASAITEAAEAGQRVFGENKVQEGLEKIQALDHLNAAWHLIGHLQSNKAKKAAAAFQCIESVDSLELLEKIDAAAAVAGHRPRVLIQVDLAQETTKHGAPPAEVSALVRAASRAQHVKLVGLMTLPPFPDAPEDSRPWFRALRELRDSLIEAGNPLTALRELSMGMSHDFEIAIEEGATMVRVGTAIFGRRVPPASPA